MDTIIDGQDLRANILISQYVLNALCITSTNSHQSCAGHAGISRGIDRSINGALTVQGRTELDVGHIVTFSTSNVPRLGVSLDQWGHVTQAFMDLSFLGRLEEVSWLPVRLFATGHLFSSTGFLLSYFLLHTNLEEVSQYNRLHLCGLLDHSSGLKDFFAYVGYNCLAHWLHEQLVHC